MDLPFLASTTLPVRIGLVLASVHIDNPGIDDRATREGVRMRLTDFDALSFDCYGTLIDWEHGLRQGLEKVSRLDGQSLDVDDLIETYADAEAQAEREHPGMRYPEIIARSIAATGATHGIDVPPALATEIGASIPEWPAFPDSANALERLSRRFKLIILSNVDRASFAASNTRLGVTFDAILTAEDIGSYKPDPRNFAALLEHVETMGIAPNRLLHVAQSLFHDHVPAKTAGLTTVWIDRRQDRPGHGATPVAADGVRPDWRFPSMAAFADAVDAEDNPGT
jgi:putative hydrolase of the HAD superfamily